MKTSLEEIKKKSCALKEKCNNYETALEKLRQKEKTKVGTVEGTICETKLEEMRKAWEK